MNLDELQSVRDRERQSDSLQQLRDSFYADAGELIQELRAERDEAAERAEDPFDDPEVNRITNDIKTAEQTVEAIYERRVGKLVKMASFAAADMPTEDEGLTAEERDLFEEMVASIETNRERVFAVLDGEDPDAVDTSESSDAVGSDADAAPESAGTAADATEGPDRTGSPVGSDGSPGVDAADLMGGDDAAAGEPDGGPAGSGDGSDRPVPPQNPSAAGSEADPDYAAPESVAGDGDGSPGDAVGRGGEPASADSSADPADAPASPESRSDGGSTAANDGGPVSAAGDGSGVDRRTVRITRDVGEILGVDERAYDLASDDVVTLPAANAEPLVERDAAEPLDR
ncbi:MAG: hypothetical protein ABEJ94_08595 [Halorientalis sp.]